MLLLYEKKTLQLLLIYVDFLEAVISHVQILHVKLSN